MGALSPNLASDSILVGSTNASVMGTFLSELIMLIAGFRKMPSLWLNFAVRYPVLYALVYNFSNYDGNELTLLQKTVVKQCMTRQQPVNGIIW